MMPVKPPYPRPGYLIYKASRLFIRLNETRLAARGTTVGQVPVLLALSKAGSLTQRQLTDVADVEQPSMAQLLNRMERDGLIERTPKPHDRRTNIVRLTETGQATVPEVVESLEYFNTQAYAGFSEEEKLVFTEMLTRMIANLEPLLGPDAPRER